MVAGLQFRQNKIAFLVFQCQKQYCDEKCEYGYKLDAYGCQTCECIDLCEGVTCGKMETCIKGVCGN